MQEYKIKNATNDNIEELLELSKKVTNYNNRQFLPDSMVDRFLNSPFFIEEIVQNIENMSLLVIKGKIVGFATWVQSELISLMVDPDFQGSGVASSFLNELVNEKIELYDELILECFKTNIRANKFYQKNGWQLFKTEMDVDLKIEKNYYKFNK